MWNLPHSLSRSARVTSGLTGQRVGDHTGLGTLDHIDLSGLVVDGQIAVTAHRYHRSTSHGDGHLGLGHAVSMAAERTGAFITILRSQMSAGVHFGGNDIRLVRQQQHIIISKAELGENRREGEHTPIGRSIHREVCSHTNTI